MKNVTYKSVESKTSNITLGAYKKMIDTVYADLNCQSVTRWEVQNKQSYLVSLILNTAPSKFILAHVKSCYNSAEISNDKKSMEYFTQFLSTCDYLNLDSNNRTVTIGEFVDDKFDLPLGNYVVGDEVYTITKDTCNYSTLPTGMKCILDSRKLTLEIYLNVNQEDITRLFLVVNSGVALNAPELRNPIISNVAEEIRSLATKHTKTFVKNVFSQKEINRRKVDDYLSGLFMIYIDGLQSKITAKSLEEMYYDENANKLVNKFSREMDRFLKIVGKNISIFKRENGLLDLFVIYLEQIRGGKRMIEPETFIKDYIDVQIDLMKDKTEYSYNENGRSANFSELLRSREIRFNTLRNKLISEKFDASKYFVQLDSRRGGTAEEKLIAAKDQGWITPEGVEIPLEDVLSTDFEIGHIKPYADGGKTEQGNFVIQTKEDNRKLGKNPVVIGDLVEA
jgi:hypothetical protein